MQQVIVGDDGRDHFYQIKEIENEVELKFEIIVTDGKDLWKGLRGTGNMRNSNY